MRVTTWQTVEVQCECDVETDDIIAEFSQRQEEATETYWRRLIPALDSMTRIMASVTDETIAAMPFAACETLRERLATQAARYERAVVDDEMPDMGGDHNNGRR